MAYDPGAIDSTLAAVAGDDPALIAELRRAFADGSARTLSAIERASSEAEWHDAAQRMKSLAASFGAVRLMAIADEAAQAPVGDAKSLQRLRRAVARF